MPKASHRVSPATPSIVYQFSKAAVRPSFWTPPTSTHSGPPWTAAASKFQSASKLHGL